MGTRYLSVFLFFSVFAVSLCCPSAAYSQPAACGLLTEKQVSSILGVSVGAGSPIASTGCSWKSTGAPSVMVTISMQTERMFAGAKSSSPPNTTKTSISRIGDEQSSQLSRISRACGSEREHSSLSFEYMDCRSVRRRRSYKPLPRSVKTNFD
jgi:hypothetical protein